ncbi:MAG TPA: hypothetical protein PKW35_09770 [Nannocystaceae bacterium]|nr:hypothetical protein [Nannocystaceae bacterium]
MTLFTAPALLAALLVAPATPTAANAEDADARARVQGANRPSGITAIYEFDNDTVDGETLSPEGVPIPGNRRTRLPSLLQLRGHFVDKVVRMANDV